MTPPGITVIVPTHRGGHRIGGLLDSLAAQDADHELIVVDNASADATRSVLAGPSRGRGRARRSGNLGFGAAVNLAASRAEGEGLVLLNDDCVIDPGFLAAIIEPLQGDVVMSAGVLRDWADAGRIDTAGMQLDRSLMVFDYLHGEPLSAIAGASDPIGPSGAAAAFDRAAFVEAGGLR